MKRTKIDIYGHIILFERSEENFNQKKEKKRKEKKRQKKCKNDKIKTIIVLDSFANVIIIPLKIGQKLPCMVWS